MSNSVDVVRELEVKNREIYLNKLKLDLDNNYEILLITIDNIINLFTDEVTNKLLELINDTGGIKSEVIAFHKLNREYLKKLIDKRKEVLLKNINDIDSMQYKKKLEDEKEKIIQAMQEFYCKNIDNLIKVVASNNDFVSARVKEYLQKTNCERFINKISECFRNMDTILYNNYLESYQRFIDLNNRTLKNKNNV